MKYFTLTLVLLFLIINYTIAQKPSEKLQIEALIASESNHFYQRDFSSWANCYAHNEKIQWVCVEKDDVILEAYGWNFLNKFVGDYLKDNPIPSTVSISRTHWVWRKMAPGVFWITFDENKLENDQESKFKATRIIEKEGKQWKISGMFSYPAI